MKLRSIIIFLCLVSLIFISGLHSINNLNDKEIDKIITREMGKFAIPSIAVCIIKKDKVVWKKTYGLANIKDRIPATGDTIYFIASTSKLITSVAVLQLYERNMIDLDKDINDYLPFPVNNPHYPEVKLTPRILLTHRSGLAWPINEDPDFYNLYPEDSAPNLGDWLKNYITPEGKTYNHKIWKNTKPGKVELYSNIGAALLGYLVEVVSRTDFAKYCENNIFKPLDMVNTSFRVRNLPEELLAMPYYNNLTPCGQYGVPYYPSTTIRSPISEFSHFMIAIMNGGVYKNKRILSEKTVNEMLKIRYPDSWLGYMWWKYKGDWFGGQGGFRGASSLAIFQKRKKIGLLIFSNKSEFNSFYPPDGRIYKTFCNKALQF